MAPKGILNTADIVANMEIKAISLELWAVDSKLKKKANMTRIASTVAINAQFTRAFSEGSNTKQVERPTPRNIISARGKYLLFMSMPQSSHQQSICLRECHSF
jgi:urate oxidase